MKAFSTDHREFIVRWGTLLPILVLLAATSRGPLAQDLSSQPARNSAIQSHFAAAQQAQQSKDYASAEREYRAVLALAPGFAEVHMNLGLVYQLQDRIPEAMTEFRLALNLKPTLVGANFFLGVDYCKLGEGAKAIPYLNAAVHEERNRPDLWSWLATAQEMSGEIHAEVVTIKRALDLQPRDVDLLYLLGHAYSRLGKEEVVHLQELAPGSFRAEQLLAESYAASSEWPLAVIHFQNALAASPSTPGIHVELGEVLLRAGKLKSAAREFNEELRLNPHSVRAIVRRGEVKLIQGDLEGSLQDWAQAIATDEVQAKRVLGILETGFGESAFEQLPDTLRQKLTTVVPDLLTRNTPASLFALAFLAVQEGKSSQVPAGEEGSTITTDASRYSCSENVVQQALKQGRFSGLAPCVLHLLSARSPAEFRVQVAAAMLEAGDYETSLQVLADLPPSSRHSAEAAYWRARCYEKLATAAYLSLYQKDPNSHRLHQLMGDLAAARGEDRKAIEEYRAAIALKPSLPNLHYSLGHLLWKNLQIPEARVEFDSELTLNPRHAGALNDLGNTYLIEYQAEKALPYLKRALAADPQNPGIHRDLGTAYSELGDYLNAELELKLALSNDRDGSVHYKLARVYQALGEKDKAAREFALSTALNRESHDKLEKRTERLNEIERSFQDPQ